MSEPELPQRFPPEAPIVPNAAWRSPVTPRRCGRLRRRHLWYAEGKTSYRCARCAVRWYSLPIDGRREPPR